MSEDNHFCSKSSASTIHASFLVEVQKQKEHTLAGARMPPSPLREHKDRCILPFKGKHLVSCKCTCSFPHLSEAAAAGPISFKSVEECGPPWPPLDHQTQESKEPQRIQNAPGLSKASCLFARFSKAFLYVTDPHNMVAGKESVVPTEHTRTLAQGTYSASHSW